MSDQKFNIKKQGNYYVAFDLTNKTISYGKINIKTEQCIGGTLCFDALREHLAKHKVVVRKTFKLWVVIEQRTEYSNGEEVFEELEDNVQSAGHFDTIEEAEQQLSDIAQAYGGDFTETQDKH